MLASRGGHNEPAIEFDGARCLCARSKWVTCTVCTGICPGHAITQSHDASVPEFSVEKCIGCGACLSACPLEAFSAPGFTESFLLNRLVGEKPLRMHCYRAADALEDPEPGWQSCDLGVCFAALSPGCLFELARMRECVFDSGACVECSLFESVRETIKINFGIARNLLSGWELEGYLKETAGLFTAETASADTATAVDPAAAGFALPAHRRPLSSLRSRFHGAQATKVDVTSRTLFRTTVRRAPSWRTRLAREWSRLQAMGQSAPALLLPYPAVDQDVCRGCGTCMQFCMTGAIVHTVEDGVFSYTFLPGLCVECGLCIASCTNTAIHRDYRASTAPFARSVVLSKPARHCARCRAPFIGGGESDLCMWCTGEPDVRELVEYARVKMHLDDVTVKDGP